MFIYLPNFNKLHVVRAHDVYSVVETGSTTVVNTTSSSGNRVVYETTRSAREVVREIEEAIFGPKDASSGVAAIEANCKGNDEPVEEGATEEVYNGGLRLKYFVLKPKGYGLHAKASRMAMYAYANVVSKENLALAKELNQWARREERNAEEG